MNEVKTGFPTATRRFSSQSIIGVAVIVIGLLLLLNTMDVIDSGNIFRWIPSLFVLLGIWQLVTNGMRNWVGPVIMIGVAGMVQLAVLDVVTFNVFGLIWPVVLIVIGLAIIFGRSRSGVTAGDDAAEFSALAVLGGTNRVMTSADFRGGDVTAIFGGAEIDLRNASVSERPAVINVFALFGGVGIKASPDMLIRNEIVAVLGGTGDERRQRKALAGEMPEVVVKGFVAFGGVGIEEN